MSGNDKKFSEEELAQEMQEALGDSADLSEFGFDSTDVPDSFFDDESTSSDTGDSDRSFLDNTNEDKEKSSPVNESDEESYEEFEDTAPSETSSKMSTGQKIVIAVAVLFLIGFVATLVTVLIPGDTSQGPQSSSGTVNREHSITADAKKLDYQTTDNHAADLENPSLAKAASLADEASIEIVSVENSTIDSSGLDNIISDSPELTSLPPEFSQTPSSILSKTVETTKIPFDGQKAISENSDNISDILKVIDKNSSSITEVDEFSNANKRALLKIITELKALREENESIKSDISKIKEGRELKTIVGNSTRLGDFSVLEITDSGRAIAKSPKGKEISLVQGERIRSKVGSLVVESIRKDGTILFSKHWFIDSVRANPSQREASLTKSRISKPPKVIAKPVTPPSISIIQKASGKPSGTGTPASYQLTNSMVYQLIASVSEFATIRNCETGKDTNYRVGENIPYHGSIRAIELSRILTDTHIISIRSCNQPT